MFCHDTVRRPRPYSEKSLSHWSQCRYWWVITMITAKLTSLHLKCQTLWLTITLHRDCPHRTKTLHQCSLASTGLCSYLAYRVRGVDGSCAKHLAVEYYTVVMLLTFILIIIISIPLFHSRLKTFLFCKFFPA